jgi:hypothetical protein
MFIYRICFGYKSNAFKGESISKVLDNYKLIYVILMFIYRICFAYKSIAFKGESISEVCPFDDRGLENNYIYMI